MRRVALTLALLAIAVAWAPTGAGAAKPCWQVLVDDWSDGAISNLYPIGCYRQALANMPEDVRLYSSASDDINRALAGRSVGRSIAGSAGSSASSASVPAATAASDSGLSAPLVLAVSLAGLVALVGGAGYVASRKRRGVTSPGDREI